MIYFTITQHSRTHYSWFMHSCMADPKTMFYISRPCFSPWPFQIMAEQSAGKVYCTFSMGWSYWQFVIIALLNRSGFRRISHISINLLGLLNWHIILLICSNKTGSTYEWYSNKAVMTLYHICDSCDALLLGCFVYLKSKIKPNYTFTVWLSNQAWLFFLVFLFHLKMFL